MQVDPNNPDFWDDSYRSDRFPWDLGKPNPVFERLLAEGGLKPGRMLVVGAGFGYDARLFARHGFAVTAVDFATEAVKKMHELAEPDAPVDVVQADFFWLPPAFDNAFDYVLEYVFFCAIDPKRREDYADVVARVLKPGGYFVGMAFPIGKRPGGPPFVVQPDEMIARFARRRLSLVRREKPADSEPSRQGIEELLILKKDGGMG